MKRLLFILILCLHGFAALAEMSFHSTPEGDHFAYVPADPTAVLVIAHGTRLPDETARVTAKRFIDRWRPFAQRLRLLLIAPVFDDARFGNTRGGYGGYRGLFGKVIGADEFTLNLVKSYRAAHAITPERFFLYGHSAGGQFAIRFAVRHPGRVLHVVASAPGRFSYPTKKAPWPYGAGLLRRKIKWGEDAPAQSVSVSNDLINYVTAAGKITVVVGADDLTPQPRRPAHIGDTRVALAQSWVRQMNLHADGEHQLQMGRNAKVKEQATLVIIPDIGHDSRGLTQAAQRAFIDAANR